MPVTAINSFQEFQDHINGDKLTIIDFWATWCGPCRAISPVFEQLSEKEEFSDIGFYKVDVDEQEHISQEVGIRAMPTFVVFKSGTKVEELVGPHPANLEKLIMKAKGSE